MGYADDYVQVNQRVEAFKKDWPEGSLQSDIVELTAERVTVKAYAYRTPNDTRPGIGHSFMNIPGSTNFTRGSELENTETSAWGRALAALGYEVKKSIASAEEVANKSGAMEPLPAVWDPGAPGSLTPKQKALIKIRMREAGLEGQQMVALAYAVVGKRSTKDMTSADMDALLEALKDPALVAAAQVQPA